MCDISYGCLLCLEPHVGCEAGVQPGDVALLLRERQLRGGCEF